MFRIKYSREITLKLLYQIDLMDLFKLDVEDIFANNAFFFKGVNDLEKNFIMTLLNIIKDDREEIDMLISKNLRGWKLERLNPIDRNLLRIGIAESKVNDKKIVIIDDLVRIAKKYGAEDSYKIVNALLDSVIK
jgi:N utilization substance protein B